MASVAPLPRRRWRLLRTLKRWVDTGSAADHAAGEPGRIDWLRAVPFALMHLACIAVIWVGISWTAVIVAAALYAVRMFAITAFTTATSRTGRSGHRERCSSCSR